MKPETALSRAIVSLFAAQGITASIERIRNVSWASATFSGTRHELQLRLSGLLGRALLPGLGEREFELPGHVLIDIAATDARPDGADLMVAVEALTVESD